MSGRDAYVSPCRTYRYRLRRWWNQNPEQWALWIMLNPSTADAAQDDPTIRRCISFTKDWGLDGLMVGNLYALRSSDPSALENHPSPIGPENGFHLREMAKAAAIVICGWGVVGSVNKVGQIHVARLLHELEMPAHCLGTTKAGHPRHPLYVKSGTSLLEFPI